MSNKKKTDKEFFWYFMAYKNIFWYLKKKTVEKKRIIGLIL